jgi:hypothetical protein
MAHTIRASLSNTSYSEPELNALRMAFVNHAAHQGEVPAELWRDLAVRGLVLRVRAIDDL